MKNVITRRPAALVGVSALAIAGALALSGCAASASGDLTVTDPWIKATDTDMTGVFAAIENTTGEDLQFVSAESDIAHMTQLHETIVQSDGSSMMQETEGGFAVAAGETLTLEPGGDHIMLMDLSDEILPGDAVTVTLTTDTGETFEITAIAKEYTGAQETYAPDGSLTGGGTGGDSSEHSNHETDESDEGHGDH